MRTRTRATARAPFPRPFPELVEGEEILRPYEITDTTPGGFPSEGMVDKNERRLFVPLNARGAHVILHELAHVKWSPTRLPRFSPRAILLAVEDGRINLGLERVRLPLVLSRGELARVVALADRDLEEGNVAMLALRSLAALGTNACGPLVDLAGEAPGIGLVASEMVSRARSRLLLGARRRRAPVASFGLVRRIAAEIARELRALGLLDAEALDRPACLGSCPGEGDGPGPGIPGAGARRADGGGIRSGRMTERVAPLAVECARVRRRNRTWRPATEGSVVRWIHRQPIDGAIFRRPARRAAAAGGSVLVDTSGSMSLDAGGVDRILRAAPAATLVAIYSGRGEEGELRVVAREGRRAAPEHLEPFGPGNVVDLPALQWIARHPRPRIWISDGRVTGVGDDGSAALRRRCREICERWSIRRVRTVEEAAELLERG